MLLLDSHYYQIKYNFRTKIEKGIISQLINGICRALQKLLRYFNGTIISTFFVSLFSVLPAIFCLNLNEVLISEKSFKTPALLKDGLPL